MFDDTSLDNLFASNHSCSIRLGPNYPKIQSINSSVMWKYDLKTRGYIKIASVLSAPYEDGINMQHFDAIPVSLVHEVLEFVASYPVKNIWGTMSETLLRDPEVQPTDGATQVGEVLYGEPNDYDIVFYSDDDEDEGEGEGDEDCANEATRQVQVKSLTNLYYTMNEWVVPNLFANRND